MIRSELGAINAQANFAQSLGTTTRTIQVLTFAGDLAEVSMDKIATPEKIDTEAAECSMRHHGSGRSPTNGGGEAAQPIFAVWVKAVLHGIVQIPW